MIDGYYYLHENKELIYKTGTDCVADFRESNFVQAFWGIDQQDRETAWSCLIEALATGAKKERIFELAEKWGCNDNDAKFYADRIGVVLEMDGNQWCAHRQDFVNLQESPIGFGDTCLESMAGLCKELGFFPTKMNWHSTFSKLVNKEHSRKT